MALVTATVSNNGVFFRPHLVRAVMDRMTGRLQELPVVAQGRLKVKKKTLNLVKQAMEEVVTEGTAKRAGSSLVKIAGKTGTAQTASIRITDYEDVPKKLRDHAWFVSYAPADDPRIAVVVLVEHMGHGGSAAAPLAKQMIEGYIQLPPIAPVVRMASTENKPVDTPRRGNGL
jgi:penicillin-binding protein 2